VPCLNFTHSLFSIHVRSFALPPCLPESARLEEQVFVRKRADNPQGSKQDITKTSKLTCSGPTALCNQRTEKMACHIMSIVNATFLSVYLRQRTCCISITLHPLCTLVIPFLVLHLFSPSHLPERARIEVLPTCD